MSVLPPSPKHAAPAPPGRDAASRGVSPRTRARRAAVQALYQWQLTGDDVAEIERQFHDERLEATGGRVDRDYFHWLLHEVGSRAPELDGRYEALLDRPLAQLDPVERAVLRIGVLELTARPEIPPRVVLDEAIELAKCFGAEQSHRYVNGILDKVARQTRRPR